MKETKDAADLRKTRQILQSFRASHAKLIARLILIRDYNMDDPPLINLNNIQEIARVAVKEELTP